MRYVSFKLIDDKWKRHESHFDKNPIQRSALLRRAELLYHLKTFTCFVGKQMHNPSSAVTLHFVQNPNLGKLMFYRYDRTK